MADARTTTRVAASAAAAALAVALSPPADGWADRSLAGHMVQHVVLVTVVAPLVALAVSAAGRAPRIAAAVRTRPGVALLVTAPVSVVGFAVWHVPAWYDAAARSLPVHVLEHATLVLSALGLWWVLLVVGAEGRPAGLVALFAATLPMTALGLLMTLASTPWYAHYAGGSPAAALTDQQVAGVVMWGFGGLATTVGAAVLVVSWLHGLEAPNEPVPGAVA